MHKVVFELKDEVKQMGQLCLEMLDKSMEALINQDVRLANEVVVKKDFIRKYDAEIEAKALRMIALYQPMAIDLRRIATILKIITYLARIGRYGKDIASYVEELSVKPYPASSVNLKHMWEHVKTMIQDSIQAFEQSDIELLRDFTKRDDEIDEMRWSIFRENISYMLEDPKTITACAHFIMIARYLERCADNACKIAEKIHYMVTGNHIEIS